MSLNDKDQNGVLIFFGILGGSLLLLKAIKFFPLVLFVLPFGFILSGTWNLKTPLLHKIFIGCSLYFIPLGVFIFLLGWPSSKIIYRGIFGYSWGIHLLSLGTHYFNQWVEDLFYWMKNSLLLKSLTYVDVQTYLLKCFQLSFLAQFLFLFLNKISKGAFPLPDDLTLKVFSLIKPLTHTFFLNPLNPHHLTLTVVKISLSLMVLIFYFLNPLFSPMIPALSLPYFIFPLLGVLLQKITPQFSYKLLTSHLKEQAPKDKILIGHQMNDPKQKVYLTQANLNYHVQVIGGSGSGKTTLIQVILSQILKLKMGILFIDLKADLNTIEWIKNEAAKAHRTSDLEFFCLTKHSISEHFNPLKGANPQEILTQIMSSLEWSEPYYRAQSSHFLSDLITSLYELKSHQGEDLYLNDIARYASNPELLTELSTHPQLNPENKKRVFKWVKESKERLKDTAGLTASLSNLMNSSAGPLLKKPTSDSHSINIMESLSKGKINYFLLNSMSDKESCVITGKLILQNIIRVIGQLYDNTLEQNRAPSLLIIDEFASFATEEFIDLLNRSRGAKLGIMVAHQSRGDLMRVSPTFCDQLERNCNTKLIFGTDSPNDAEYFASQAGTRTVSKSTERYKRTLLGDHDTGEKSVRETEEFIIHPNQIRKLAQGQLLKISRLVDSECKIVQIAHYGLVLKKTFDIALK